MRQGAPEAMRSRCFGLGFRSATPSGPRTFGPWRAARSKYRLNWLGGACRACTSAFRCLLGVNSAIARRPETAVSGAWSSRRQSTRERQRIHFRVCSSSGSAEGRGRPGDFRGPRRRPQGGGGGFHPESFATCLGPRKVTIASLLPDSLTRRGRSLGASDTANLHQRRRKQTSRESRLLGSSPSRKLGAPSRELRWMSARLAIRAATRRGEPLSDHGALTRWCLDRRAGRRIYWKG